MKSLIAGICTTSLLLAPPVASPLAAQVELGGALGLAVSTFGGDDADDAGSSTGFLAGARLSFPLTDAVSLRPGAYFVQKGSEETEDGTTFSINLNYLEVPVLFVFEVPTEGSLGVHFLLGPVMALELGCDVEGSGGGASVTLDCDNAAFEGLLDTKTSEFGLEGGVGVTFSTGSSASVFVEGLYNLGLSSISDLDDVDIKNRAFVVQGGVSFPIGG